MDGENRNTSKRLDQCSQKPLPSALDCTNGPLLPRANDRLREEACDSVICLKGELLNLQIDPSVTDIRNSVKRGWKSCRR